MEFFLAYHRQTGEYCIAEDFESVQDLDKRLWDIKEIDPKTFFGPKKPLVILKIKTKKGGIKLLAVHTLRDLEGVHV